MAKKVPYSDEERFDLQFKKRQCEIRDEISIWSQSEPFQSKIREQSLLCLSNQDVLGNLSTRLFENGNFVSYFKDLTKKEIESNTQKTWIERLSKGWGFFTAVVLGVIITVLAEFFIRKCL